jgi:hypothetical protein
VPFLQNRDVLAFQRVESLGYHRRLRASLALFWGADALMICDGDEIVLNHSVLEP